MRRKKKKKTTPTKRNTSRVNAKAYFWKIFFSFALLLIFLSLVSQNPKDLAILNGGVQGQIQNWIGLTGAVISKYLLLFFGLASYLITLFLLFISLQSFRKKPYCERRGFILCSIFFIIGVTMLFAMWPEHLASITDSIGIGRTGSPKSALSGGVFGQFLASPQVFHVPAGIIRRYIGTVGCAIIALALTVSGTVFLWHQETLDAIKKFFSFFKFLGFLKETFRIFSFRKKQTKENQPSQKESFNSAVLKVKEIEESRKKIEKRRQQQELLEKKNKSLDESSLFYDEPPVQIQTSNDNKNTVKVADSDKKTTPTSSNYKLPHLNLLHDLSEIKGDSADIINLAKETLQDTLNSFGVDARVTGAITGPRVTRLEVVPSPGVRVQKISSLESNIKLDLKAESIRILAPIPGKDAVGIEIPNRASSIVSFKGILKSKEWSSYSNEIPVVLGKNVAGEPIITDLARAPHLLIAGATGSGKSVCVNTLIMSLLYRFSPAELGLIMVDPKVVEFEMYKNLPHLITPIVNEPKKVPLALRWCINEMEKRYRILAKARVKNLYGYNNRKSSKQLFDDDGNPLPEKMPYIVIIIDELADIMMAAKADVETSIARIAQKARAVGLHLVLATQRPSVQIITGVIKANLPTRIAFRVTSVTDSRVILDHKGADTLLGRGDMLFIPPGSAKLERIQGAMLSDREIEEVVAFCSEQKDQDFDYSVTSPQASEQNPESSLSGSNSLTQESSIDDNLVKQAVDIIKRERKASTSYLQRRLKIGYNRAAEIIDILEEKGIIGPQIGSSRREILIDPDENIN